MLLGLSMARRSAEMAESSARSLLDRSLRVAGERAAALEPEAPRRLAGLAAMDVLAGSEQGLNALAASRGLDLLELVEDGVLRASHQWDAGIDLPDDDVPFAEGGLRLESVASGFGRERRLGVVGVRAVEIDERPMELRGGFLVDGEWLARTAALAGVRLAWRDTRRGEWYPPGGPAIGWTPAPTSSGGGLCETEEGPFLWRASFAAPDLLLVAGVPHEPLLAVAGEERALLLRVGAAALLIALVGALLLASRLSQPVRDLADEVTRLGALSGSAPLPAQPWEELDRLARAFDEAAGELRSSAGRLRQAERIAEWREMARRLAHELKNPLFPMQVSMETLRRALERHPEGGSELNRLVDETTAAVLTQIDALRRVVEEFSAFARMPRPRPEPVEIRPLLERVATLQRSRAPGLELEVEHGGPATVVADAGLLERALGNLVANAADAQGGGGRVWLRSRGEGDEVLLEVEDLGPGLDPEQREQVFTPYFTTRQGGTGLGLPIVSAIAADHGGRVELESEPGRGARFTLRLPRRGPSTPVQSPSP